MNHTTSSAALDLEEERDLEKDMIQTPFEPANVDIASRKFTLSELLERIKHSELRLPQDFQRRAAFWDGAKKSRLVESCLLRIPMQAFYFCEEPDGKLTVVDGLQRLCAILHFADHGALNQATASKLNGLRLEGLQFLPDCMGRSFQELARPFQQRLMDMAIDVHVVRASTPKPVMFNLFARLNQHGQPLTAQEIRSAIFPGGWQKSIRKMAQGTEFLKATEGLIPTDRQQDMEMALRFVALWTLGVPFQRPAGQTMDQFLNEVVGNHLMLWNGPKWDEVHKTFEKGLRNAVSVFGKHAFRRSGSGQIHGIINKGLFEAQLLALASLHTADINKLAQRQQQVMDHMAAASTNGSPLDLALASDSGRAEASNIRVECLKQLIFEVLHA